MTSIKILFFGFTTLVLSAAVHCLGESKADVCILAVPTYGKEAILLDNRGKLAKVWQGTHANAGGARILDGGTLLHVISMPLERQFLAPGVTGGGVEILNPDNSVKWQFWNAVTDHIAFGDAVMLPNGNVLMPILQWKTKADAEAAGRDPQNLPDNGILVPGLMEVSPSGKEAGVPVWEWSVWDHIYQSRHPALPNYAFPKPKEGCIDVNLALTSSRLWLSPFQVDFDPKNDLAIVTIRELGEVWVIDHSTSTQMAKQETGGKQGHGGRLLQRLGGREPRSEFIVSAYLDVSRDDATSVEILHLDGSSEVGTIGGDGRIATQRDQGLLRISSPAIAKKEGHEAIFLADGEVIVSNIFSGSVARISSDLLTRWSFKNEMGNKTFQRRTPKEGQTCCGGRTAAEDSDSKSAPSSIEAAPLTHMRPYSTECLRAVLGATSSSNP